MILLLILKKNFSLIDKGFYSKVVKCMLDISSLLTTNIYITLSLFSLYTIINHKSHHRCELLFFVSD